MENVHINQTDNPPTRSRLSEFMTGFPLIQFIGAGMIGLAATWTTVQLTQNSQAAEIRRNAEKIAILEEERKETVSREIFEERTRSILDEQRRQREMLEKFLSKK